MSVSESSIDTALKFYRFYWMLPVVLPRTDYS